MITGVANSPNFKAVYYSPGDFNIQQINTVKKIASSFKSFDLSNQRNRTYEEVFEKKGYDFFIVPHPLKKNSVQLISKNQNENKKIIIGTYNDDYCFDMLDVQNSFKSDKLRSSLMSVAGILAIFATLMFAFKTKMHNYEKIPQKTMNIVKDSVENYTQKSLKDTIKFIRNNK